VYVKDAHIMVTTYRAANSLMSAPGLKYVI
jgi:hypothetical protein